jgi:hypothetical protein
MDFIMSAYRRWLWFLASESRSSHTCPTKRALDAGDSAASTSIFLALSFLCSQTESTPTPAPVTLTGWATRRGSSFCTGRGKFGVVG